MSPDSVFFFHGGLGDVLMRIYQRTEFETLTRSEDAWVLLGNGNPYNTELFRWLPNADKLRLVDCTARRETNKWGPKDKREERWTWREYLGWLGLPEEAYCRGEARAVGYGWDHVWTAPDQRGLESGVVVIQSHAGSPRRDVPPAVLQVIVQGLEARGLRPVIVTRDFIRYRSGVMQHQFEEVPTNLRRLQVRNLSVPATLRMVQDAVGTIGLHSALVHAAAGMARPTLALQNGIVLETREKSKTYFYYEDYPHVTTLNIEKGAIDLLLNEWIDTLV